jgi:hypothetical protein
MEMNFTRPHCVTSKKSGQFKSTAVRFLDLFATYLILDPSWASASTLKRLLNFFEMHGVLSHLPLSESQIQYSGFTELFEKVSRFVFNCAVPLLPLALPNKLLPHDEAY